MVLQRLEYDVAVIGGGTSGVIAAIAAARNGAETLLVERNEFLGGMLVSNLGLLGYRDRQGKAVVGGIAQELVDRLNETNDTQGHNPCPILNSLTPINPAMMQLRLVQLCHESGVHLLMGCEAVDARVEGARLTQVSLFGKNHRYDLRAKVFIDASGDGELCLKARVPMMPRRSDADLQPASLIFSLSNVDREPLLQYAEHNPEEVKTPDGYEMDTTPAFYRQSVGYNLLGLDRIIRTARANGDYRNIPRDRFSTITNPLPDRMTINNTRIMHFDGSDLYQLTGGIREGFRQMGELLAFIPKYIPGYEHSELSNVSPMLGVRESRRFVGQKTLTSDAVLRGEIPDDTVALCGYNIDIHHGNDEGSELYIVQQAYGIPYGTMVNDQVDGLLFTGRLISVDRDTYASARVMSTCMALGEAAGCAAALCAREHTSPSKLDVQRLRALLRAQNAILEVERNAQDL